jgi:hypothetical protein
MTNGRQDKRRSAEVQAHLRHYPSWEQIATASQLAHVAKIDSRGELRRAFRDDRARYRFLERLRFPDGFVCWRCGSEGSPVRGEPGLLCCNGCGLSERITAGTVLEDAGLSLPLWFDALWTITADEPPSIAQLTAAMGQDCPRVQRLLSCVRALLAEAESTPLEGVVELDGRVLDGAGRHAIALLAAERRAGGRVRVRHSTSVAAPVVRAFVVDAITPGSMVVTDCWSGYVGLPSSYHHQLSNADLAGADMRAVRDASAALRSWLAQRASPRPAELQHAFDAFCLHRNNATLTRGELFAQLARFALNTCPPPHGKRRRSGVRARTAHDEAAPEREASGR